jgi:hypothetical protein
VCFMRAMLGGGKESSKHQAPEHQEPNTNRRSHDIR